MKLRVVSKMFAGIVALSISGCATVSNSLTYTSENTDALLVYRYDGTTPTIVRIDTESGNSTGVRYNLDTSLDLGSRSLDRNFGVRNLPPGDYAIVNNTYATMVGLNSFVEEDCHEYSAPVFQISAGRVNIVEGYRLLVSRAAGGRVDHTLMSDAESTLQAYPEVEAPRVLAESLGFVSFSNRETRGVMFQRCGSGSFVEQAAPPPVKE